MKAFMKAAAGVLGVGVAGLTYGVIEARRFVVRCVEVPVLEPGSSPLRVLHISDFHMLARQKAKREFIRGLVDLEPDLVIDTGDNFCSADSLQPLLDDMAGLLKRPGVFVFGSNDYLVPAFKNPFSYLLRGRSRASEEPIPELPHEELRQAFTAVLTTPTTSATITRRSQGLPMETQTSTSASPMRPTARSLTPWSGTGWTSSSRATPMADRCVCPSREPSSPTVISTPTASRGSHSTAAVGAPDGFMSRPD